MKKGAKAITIKVRQSASTFIPRRDSGDLNQDAFDLPWRTSGSGEGLPGLLESQHFCDAR